MNRRSLIKSLAVATAGAAMPPSILKAASNKASFQEPVSAKSAFDTVHEVARGVFFVKGKTTYFENGSIQEVECNNGWIVFDDFVLVIDANLPGNAPYLLREIKKRTSRPIRFVLNTHHHGDHLYGNGFWAQQGATIIGSTALIGELKKYETGYYGNTPGRWDNMKLKREDLEAFPLYPPPITFDRKLILHDRNRNVELLHLGVGHTAGDAVAWLPEEKIMFVGDSCLNGPYNLFRDAHIASWIGTLEIMKGYQPDVIIPGHGDAGNGDTIKRQQHYLKQVYEWVKAEIAIENKWSAIQAKLYQLRKHIENDVLANRYLIAEPSVVPDFSLESHVKKVFEEINA